MKVKKLRTSVNRHTKPVQSRRNVWIATCLSHCQRCQPQAVAGLLGRSRVRGNHERQKIGSGRKSIVDNVRCPRSWPTVSGALGFANSGSAFSQTPETFFFECRQARDSKHTTALSPTYVHHTTPHHTTPHLTTPHHTTPHHTTPHHTTPHHTTPHHTTPHHTTPHHTTPHHTTPLHTPCTRQTVLQRHSIT